MFSRFLSINPPEPELLIDISREHKANSDYSDTGYPYIHNYGSKGGGAAYACSAANLKSPELYYNPWNFLSTEIEATSPAAGVFHVTKLWGSPRLGTFYIELKDFVGFNSKISIFINRPAGKENASNAIFRIREGTGAATPFSQTLTDGVNVIEIPEASVFDIEMSIAEVVIPKDWWDSDENGTVIDTNTDFYVVFFPVLDESQCNGYGEYLVPKFNNAVWRKDSENIVVSDDGLIVDTTQSEHFWDLRIAPEAYYKDDYIAVYSPEFFNVSCAQNLNIIAEFRGVLGDSSEGEQLSETIGTAQVIGRTTGTNVPFYGGVAFKNSYNAVYLQFYFSATGVFTMLPYNNDRFTVAVTGDTNNYGRLMISETEHFHDKSELQTLIAKCKNTLSGSNSLLYRNEVNDGMQKIGLYGIRFATTSETVTDNSFKACLTDGGLATTENRKSIVSYLDGRVLQTNDYGDYELLYKDIVMSVVLLKNEITAEDCVDSGSLLFARRSASNNFSGQLYYLIGFKNRLTPWQIAYQIKQMN